MISIIFVPVFLFNTLFASLYVRFYNSKIDDGYRSFQTESYSNLNYKLELYQAILDRTVYNSSIAEAIVSINPGRMISAYEASVIIDSEIENITFGSAMEEVHNFSIFPCDTNVKAIGKYMSSMRNVEHEQWVTEMGGRSKYIFIENRFGRNILSLVQTIYHAEVKTNQIVPVAIAKLEINLDSIMSNSIKETDSSIGIEIIKDGTLCYEYGNVSSPKHEKRLLYIENSLLDEHFRIRYIFDRTDCTSEYVGIQEEIEHIKSYLDIQKIRYSNKFEVFYDISEKAARCRVLKFILQPIVENVIKHAVQEGEGRYFISVVADVEDGVLSINISDDGNGISEERLERIRRNLSGKVADGEKSIGLRNVHMRLRITYGDDYGITVTSKEFVGTSVVLKFPVEYSKEKGER